MTLKDKIKYIKKNRLSPCEVAIQNILIDCNVIKQNLYDNKIFYKRRNDIQHILIYEKDTSELKFDNKIWTLLTRLYKVEDEDFKNSLKKIYYNIYKIETNPIKTYFY